MMQGGPLEHCIAAKAVALKEAIHPGVQGLRGAHRPRRAGAGAGPRRRGLRIVSGGTDSHLILADLRPLGIDGKTAEAVADEVGIALNKNQIPYDPNPPLDPLGDPRGHARPVDARYGRAGDARDREHPGRRLKHPEDGGRQGEGPRPGARPDAAVPALPVARTVRPAPGPVAARRPGPHTEPSVSAYLLIFLASAGTTFLVTPLVRRMVVRMGAIDQPRGPQGPSRGDADDGWPRDVCGLPGRARRLVPAAVLLRHAGGQPGAARRARHVHDDGGSRG